MIETELRIRVNDVNKLEKKLTLIGCEYKKTEWQKDTYYDNDVHEIRNTDRAIRLRQIRLNDAQNITCFVTFKGINMDHVSNVREENEYEISDLDEYKRKFLQLGYHPVSPEVEKIRKEYKYGDITVCIDNVKNIGIFMEMEKISEEYSEESKKELKELLELLGYEIDDNIKDSYLDILQKMYE